VLWAVLKTFLGVSKNYVLTFSVYSIQLLQTKTIFCWIDLFNPFKGFEFQASAVLNFQHLFSRTCWVSLSGSNNSCYNHDNNTPIGTILGPRFFFARASASAHLSLSFTHTHTGERVREYTHRRVCERVHNTHESVCKRGRTQLLSPFGLPTIKKLVGDLQYVFFPHLPSSDLKFQLRTGDFFRNPWTSTSRTSTSRTSKLQGPQNFDELQGLRWPLNLDIDDPQGLRWPLDLDFDDIQGLRWPLDLDFDDPQTSTSMTLENFDEPRPRRAVSFKNKNLCSFWTEK